MNYVEISYCGESIKLPTNAIGALPSLRKIMHLLQDCAIKKLTTPEFACIPEEESE